MQDYQSIYLDLYHELREKNNVEKEDIRDDIVFEIELVKQIEVDFDYILEMVKKYHADHILDEEAEFRIMKAVESSTKLRSKKELIQEFLTSINVNTDVEKDWEKFVKEKKEEDIAKIIKEENLKQKETKKLLEKSFETDSLETNGRVIDYIMPPISRFNGNRPEKKKGIIGKIKGLFEKYSGLFAG